MENTCKTCTYFKPDILSGYGDFGRCEIHDYGFSFDSWCTGHKEIKL